LLSTRGGALLAATAVDSDGQTNTAATNPTNTDNRTTNPAERDRLLPAIDTHHLPPTSTTIRGH
jgi:hypothetical protein